MCGIALALHSYLFFVFPYPNAKFVDRPIIQVRPDENRKDCFRYSNHVAFESYSSTEEVIEWNLSNGWIEYPIEIIAGFRYIFREYRYLDNSIIKVYGSTGQYVSVASTESTIITARTNISVCFFPPV